MRTFLPLMTAGMAAALLWTPPSQAQVISEDGDGIMPYRGRAAVSRAVVTGEPHGAASQDARSYQAKARYTVSSYDRQTYEQGFAAPGGGPATTSASDGLRLIAKAWSLDNACRFLSPRNHRELQSYMHQADLAAARTEGPYAARAAYRQGIRHKQNPYDNCRKFNHDFVKTVFYAARRVARNERPSTAFYSPGLAIYEALRRDRLFRRPPYEPMRKARVHIGKRLSVDSELSRYEILVRRYYTMLRCRGVQGRKQLEVWKRLRDAHYSLLDTAGAQAVSDAAEQGKAAAAATPCGKMAAWWRNVR